MLLGLPGCGHDLETLRILNLDRGSYCSRACNCCPITSGAAPFKTAIVHYSVSTKETEDASLGNDTVQCAAPPPPAFPTSHLPVALANLIDYQPNATQSGKDKWVIRWTIPRPSRLADIPFLPTFWLAFLSHTSNGTYVRGHYKPERQLSCAGSHNISE